ncbi:MAG: RICIN domain-containing protein [Sphingomonadaceae bacterium]
MISIPHTIRTLAMLMFASFALGVANPAQAQMAADLQDYKDVDPGQPQVIDGVWRLQELGKRVMIESGHVIALDDWLHLMAWQVSRGMVTSTDLRQSDEGEWTAYDALLKRKMTWRINKDGSIRATGGTGLFAPYFTLLPIELNYPEAFEQELAYIGGAPRPQPGPPPRDEIVLPPEDEAPVLPGPPERPGPIDIDPSFTYALKSGNNRCLQILESDRAKQGGKVITATCRESANARFVYLADDGLIVTGDGMCLEASGAGKSASVSSFGCDGNPRQKWERKQAVNVKLPGFGNSDVLAKLVRFEHASGGCLHVLGSEKLVPMNIVTIRTCSNDKKQVWGMQE